MPVTRDRSGRIGRIAAGLLVPAALALACQLPGLIPPTATPLPTATSSPTPTTTPTPTPTAQPAELLTEAAQALFVGDWELAMAEYQRLQAESDDPDLQAAAALGIGDTLSRERRYGEAVPALTDFLQTHAGHPLSARGHLLRARAQLALGLAEPAVQDFQAYLDQQAGDLDVYIEEWLGDALRQAGRPLEAVPHYLNAAGLPRLGGAAAVQLKAGVAYLEGDDPANAVQQMDLLYASQSEPAYRAAANYVAGQALEALDDWPSAQARYLDSVVNYPQAYDSYQGLIRLVQAGVDVDEYQRALIDYYAGAYGPALNAFDRHLAEGGSAAGYYYRGLTNLALELPEAALGDFQLMTARYPDDPLWADGMLQLARVEWAWLDRYAEAIDTYLELVAARPDSPRAPEALYQAGRVSERANELSRAAEIWLRLPAEYPGSPLAQAAAYQAGLARFRVGSYAAGRDAFLLSDALADAPDEHAASRLWEGKTYLAEGQAGEAVGAWEAARGADPTGYYSVRAEDLLNDRRPFDWPEASGFTADQAAERAEAEAWMRQVFGVQAAGPLYELDSSLSQDRRMIRGRALWELGLFDLARNELEALREAVADDPLATYRLMHTFLDLGLYRSAIFAARQVLTLAGMDDAATLDAPVYFNRVRFGLYFRDLILPAASSEGLDPLFVFSVVRQESLFEGFATSYAEARGLMQVIPSTGQAIADQLGWPPGYQTEDLYRPMVSVRFGSHYLREQLDRFQGDAFAALSAYNAGPGNTLLWKELAPQDPDLFLEIVRLEQPQLYIRTIYEVYAIYQRLYGGG